MKHLCYVYINEYKCLKDIELIIDPHYNYQYEKASKKLVITENKEFPINFFGPKTHSLAAIVGNNTAGKSTAMSFLLDFLVEGAPKDDINGIVIYEDNKVLKYQGNNISVYFEKTLLNQSCGYSIPCFYYNGHFSPYINADSRNSDLAGYYNASDNIRLVKDMESYYNVGATSMNYPLIDYLNSYVAQNAYRICMMLADEHFSDCFDDFKDFPFPHYVILGINQSGKSHIENDILGEKRLREKNGQDASDLPKVPPFTSCKGLSASEQFLSLLIYHNLLNLINDRLGGWRYGFDVIDKWRNQLNGQGSVLDQFQAFANAQEAEIKQFLISQCEVYKTINSIATFQQVSSGNGFFYIDCKQDKDKLAVLAKEVLNKDFYLTSKFFDFHYAQTLSGNTILSSGEQQLLNLFSRIYDATILQPGKFSNLDSSCLFLLDEAENAFHPDWQRRYIDLLIRFLERLDDVAKSHNTRQAPSNVSVVPDFQIIISTHSPILLSDIPKNCVNFLKKEENGSTINAPRKEIENTFGANVFNLYRMSFFMEDGLVGEFARKKINDLNKRIDDAEFVGADEKIKKIEGEINMIGDEDIRKYLLDKFETKLSGGNIDSAIEYYQKKIDKLKKMKGECNE